MHPDLRGAVSILDHPLIVTGFCDQYASVKHEEVWTLRSLQPRIKTVTAGSKTALPWLKLARFGDVPTPVRIDDGGRKSGGSLRHDANVVAVSGIEADYDGNVETFEFACETLSKQGIAALVYTSPSHNEDAPRWRVLCPLSTEMPPEARSKMLGRLNGLFRGAFSAESWALSQGYFYGSVSHNPSHQVELIDGTPIDLHDDLDEIWTGKPNTIPKGAGATSGGRLDTKAMFEAILDATNFHQATVRLAGHFAARKTPYFEARKEIAAAMEEIPESARDRRWHMRFNDIDRNMLAIFGKEAVKQDEKAVAIKSATIADDADIICPVTLAGIEPKPREWIVDGWLPVGAVTSLYGGAGFGKTLLAQQLQTATATGRQFLGLRVMECESLGFYCEDDRDELHRRQAAICRHYGAPMEALGAMRWQGRFGRANVMATVEDGFLKPTEFFAFVRATAKRDGVKLLILDNVAQLFGGNENARPEVTQFVNALGAIAQDINGAVLLLGHPAKATESQFSGSTAWDAAVRSRWLLNRPKPEDEDDVVPPDQRILTKAKANYSGTGDEIPISWQDGAFRLQRPTATSEPLSFETVAQNMTADDDAFLVCLDVLRTQGRNVSHSQYAMNYAPKFMTGKAATAGMTKGQLKAAMERLFDAEVIEVGLFGYGADRKPIKGIVRKGAEPVPDVKPHDDEPPVNAETEG